MSARLSADRWIAIPAAALGAAVAIASARAPLAALVALGVLALAVLVFTRPEAILLLLVAALPWEGVLEYPSESLSVVKILGFLLFVAFVVSAVWKNQKLRAPPAVVAALVFVLIVCASLAFSSEPGSGTSTMLRYLLLAAFFFLVVQLVDTGPRVLAVLRVVTLSVTAAAVVGLISFLQGDVSRVSGPITDPNDFGYLMVAVLPLVFYLAVEDSTRRWLWAACIPIVLAALLATLSRSVVVALLALLVWALLTRKIRFGGLLASTAALLAVIGVALAFWSSLIDERLESKDQVASQNVASRQALWAGAVQMSMDNPIVGVGPGRFGAESVEYVRDNPIVLANPVTHNAYLEILAESGPFALAAFLFFLVASWTSLSRSSASAAREGDRAGVRIATAVQASLLVSVVAALFLSEQFATPFWLVGALAVAVAYLTGSHRAATGLSSP